MADHGSTSQTAGRALDILCLFHDNNELTLRDVEKLTGLSTTIFYRLLQTLSGKGFLRQNPKTKSYALGEQLLLLGYKAIRSQDIKLLARPFLCRLTEETGMECFLNICVGNSSLCLDRTYTNSDLQTSMRAGGVYALHRGASNRVLLAFLPQEEQLAFLSSLSDLPLPLDQMLEVLQEIRAKGYDYTEGQLTTGVFSVAFPIFTLNGQLEASISVAGPTYAINDSLRESFVEAVQKAADKLSSLMGFQAEKAL